MPKMRSLFLSNYYPPFSRGGYEQWCQEVANELATRGHEVSVLTSCISNESESSEDNNPTIHRLLRLEVESGLAETIVRLVKDRKRLEQENLNCVYEVINDFKPEVALIWGMWNVPRSVPALVERLLPGRVAYYLCDYWLSLPNAYIQRWQEPSSKKLLHWPKKAIGKLFQVKLAQEAPIPLKLEYPICVSHAVRDLLVKSGVPITHAEIIYGGTHVEDFLRATNGRFAARNDKILKLVYIGRLSLEKSVHTAIQAMSLLPKPYCSQTTLDIFGTGDPIYGARLESLIDEKELSQTVSLRGQVPRVQIPEVLASYDALIFSSVWEEPFARTVLEAMAAGLVVIGTTTGGTGEILTEGKTGLTFPAGDCGQLAKQITRLFDDPVLRQRLAEVGQECVVKQYTFQRMVNQIESVLQRISAAKEERI